MTNTTRRSTMLAAAPVLLALALPAGAAAAAQTSQDYPGGTPPQVLGETLSRDVPTEVLGQTVSREDEGLPLTGGDVLGLTAIGLGAIATGTVLVRRSRVRSG